jgi:hypothetical protein
MKDANKVAKVTAKLDKLSIKNNARIIDHGNKVQVARKQGHLGRQKKVMMPP